jgi:hypothetical protein
VMISPGISFLIGAILPLAWTARPYEVGRLG